MLIRAAFSGLLFSAAAAASAQVPSAITIDMSSYRFSPSALHLTAGQPVTLRFTNSAGMTHDFTAKEFFASARVLNGSVTKGKVTLEPGATATVALVPARGTYKVRCTRLFHTMRGMVGSIVVD